MSEQTEAKAEVTTPTDREIHVERVSEGTETATFEDLGDGRTKVVSDTISEQAAG